MANSIIPGGRTFSLALSVRGAIDELREQPPQGESWFNDKATGRALTNAEAITGLTCDLAEGKEMLPMGDKCGNPCGNAHLGCTGFNYGKGGGCPGYPTPAPMHDEPAASEPACTTCDGSGTVHRADGEYMGECPCSAAPLHALPVERDSNGWWVHPGIPDFDEGQEKEYRAWLASQGLEVKHAMLEWEPEHPLYDAWFDDGECDCSSWTPAQPNGDGWFTLSIHDTEDGPVWVWARPTPQGE